MAAPAQTTTLPAGCTFNADGLTSKSGTIRGIAVDEFNSVLYLVTYTDSQGGNRSVWLKSADITLAS